MEHIKSAHYVGVGFIYVNSNNQYSMENIKNYILRSKHVATLKI
jgi:hypothetical protein